MTGLLIGVTLGIAICYKLGYYDELIARLTRPLLPSPDHLDCGQCFWLNHKCGISPLPPVLVDQLIISPFCTEHTSFSWKRWNEKHLDDKGLSVDNWQSDVDNYRGFLE